MRKGNYTKKGAVLLGHSQIIAAGMKYRKTRVGYTISLCRIRDNEWHSQDVSTNTFKMYFKEAMNERHLL